MKNYLIWAGEKLEKVAYWLSWEEIMDWCTSHELTGEYSVQAYLAERE